MTIINDKGFSELNIAWLKSMVNDRVPIPGEFSATELLKPLKDIVLHRKHYKEIKTNASDLIYLAIGQAMHHSRHGIKVGNTITEDDGLKRMSWVDPKTLFTLTGQPDEFNTSTGILGDLKSTTTWNLEKKREDTFKEWSKQMSIYAFLMIQNGQPTDCSKARITVFCRDFKMWQKTDAVPHQFFEVMIGLNTPEETQAFIEERFQYLKDIRDKKREIPECTDEEKWKNPKGEFKRCMQYCSSREFCDFAKSLKE
jgi:hypothetical protein